MVCSMSQSLKGGYKGGGGSLFARSRVEKSTGTNKVTNFFHSENNPLE